MFAFYLAKYYWILLDIYGYQEIETFKVFVRSNRTSFVRIGDSIGMDNRHWL